MKKKKYIYTISLGGLYLRLISEIQLKITEDIFPFLIDEKQETVSVDIRLQKKKVLLPEMECGRDLLMKYYQFNDLFYAAAREEATGDCSVTIYKSDFSKAEFLINEEKYPGMIRKIGKVLQLFPIRQLLSNYQAFLFHSSRVVVNGKAIVFSAPSQTGKTTQARLWEKYENAEIVSNDRTLLRKMKKTFATFGYPIDGSDPVYDNREIPLGAVIVLRQGTDNRTERLTVTKALKYLMEQTIADVWNNEQILLLKQLWLDLIESYPVYLLACRPDYDSVLCLKSQLMKDGVIFSGND